ncbi:Dimer Tnp hAT domain-containing protein, partial [Aphis craccivora]
IDDGWRKLSIIDLDPEVINDLRQLNVENFWIKLKMFKKDDEFPFEIISKFILTVLSLPQSNVACERIFSKVNLIKTKSRNRLQTLSLNGLLNSSQHMQETACYKFEPTKKMYSLMTSSNLYSNNDDNSDDDEITFVNL